MSSRGEPDMDSTTRLEKPTFRSIIVQHERKQTIPAASARLLALLPRAAPLFLAVLMSLGCKGRFDPSEMSCEPMDLRACFCPDGIESTQRCMEDGGSWGDCRCSPSDADIDEGGDADEDLDDATDTSTMDSGDGDCSDVGCTAPVTEEWGSGDTSDHTGTLADTFININSEINEGSDSLNLYTFPSQRIANVILMRWDEESLPHGAEVLAAILELTPFEFVGDSYTTTLHAITGCQPDYSVVTGYVCNSTTDWVESDCCANEASLAQENLGPIIDTTVIGTSRDPVAWDLTPLVTSWTEGAAPNYGFAINSDPTAEADDCRYFRSAEYEVASERPRLTISYRAPPP